MKTTITKTIITTAIVLSLIAFAPSAQAATHTEDGSITVPTPVVLFPGTQVNELGQGVTAWLLDQTAVSGNNGEAFTLEATGGVVPDFDLIFYAEDGSFIESFATEGDESGVIPDDAARAYVHMFSGAAGEFTFVIE